MATYIIQELNTNWKPNPHEFLDHDNAIARARVIEGKTMGVYRMKDMQLRVITHNGNVYLLAALAELFTYTPPTDSTDDTEAVS